MSRDAYMQAWDSFHDVEEEYRRSMQKKDGTWEFKYWQGKKDGMRVVLAILAPNEAERKHWESYQESSQKGRATEREVLRSQVQWAYEFAQYIVQNKVRSLVGEAKHFIAWVDGSRRMDLVHKKETEDVT